MMVNVSLTGCGLAPLPHICNHSGIDAVALLTMTVSMSGWSKPVVAMPMLFKIASGVLANHCRISSRSAEVASRCLELKPCAMKAALTACECSTLQLKIIVLRPSECCLYALIVESMYLGSLNIAPICAWSKSPAVIFSLARSTIFCAE